MKEFKNGPAYRLESAGSHPAHLYLLPALRGIIVRRKAGRKLLIKFELGCGNGSVAKGSLTVTGYDVTGVDPSEEEIAHAKRSCLSWLGGSVYDDLVKLCNRFPSS